MVPQELLYSSASYAEQLSLDSNIKNSITRNRKTAFQMMT